MERVETNYEILSRLSELNVPDLNDGSGQLVPARAYGLAVKSYGSPIHEGKALSQYWLELKQLSEYWLDIDRPLSGIKLGVNACTYIKENTENVESKKNLKNNGKETKWIKKEICLGEIFVNGEYTDNSYTVCLPKLANPDGLNLILDFYIAQKFMLPLLHGSAKTLLIKNNQTIQDEFRFAGFLVRDKECHVIIADKQPADPEDPHSFHAILFPMETDFSNKGVMEATVYAARGQSAIIGKDGQVLEKDRHFVDAYDRLAILKDRFAAPIMPRSYFYYETFVSTRPWPN